MWGLVTPDPSQEKDVQMSSHLDRGMMPGSGRPRGSTRWVKGHVFLGGSGYAKRSTKMALAVVWPKMKAPRVTKRTP